MTCQHGRPRTPPGAALCFVRHHRQRPWSPPAGWGCRRDGVAGLGGRGPGSSPPGRWRPAPGPPERPSGVVAGGELDAAEEARLRTLAWQRGRDAAAAAERDRAAAGRAAGGRRGDLHPRRLGGSRPAAARPSPPSPCAPTGRQRPGQAGFDADCRLPWTVLAGIGASSPTTACSGGRRPASARGRGQPEDHRARPWTATAWPASPTATAAAGTGTPPGTGRSGRCSSSPRPGGRWAATATATGSPTPTTCSTPPSARPGTCA
jgi:hypothetical protein